MTPQSFKNRQELIEQVLQQIAVDVEDRDFTALEELIKKLPDLDLIAYIPQYLEN